MQEYTENIKLVKNSRGVWDLDPFKGCSDGIKNNPNGCYGLCYAKSIAKFRGYDFGKTVYRYFEDEKQVKRIGKKLMQTSFIDGIQPDFVRLGVMCDPSHDWDHTFGIIERIRKYNPNIVIITKHWKELRKDHLAIMDGICVNTSISALDSMDQVRHRLSWYNELKKHCKSVLRVNTADFNDPRLKAIQSELLANDNVIDNILRIPKSHFLVRSGMVNVKKHRFISGDVFASVSNENTYFGSCDKCPDKCGIALFSDSVNTNSLPPPP